MGCFICVFALSFVQKKKKTKKVVERYWEWELTNETKPIWVSHDPMLLLVLDICFVFTVQLASSYFSTSCLVHAASQP